MSGVLRRSGLRMKSMPNWPFTQSEPALAGASQSGVTPMNSPWATFSSMPQPVPQKGQMERTLVTSSATALPSIFLSMSAPVGHVWMHWPQKVQLLPRRLSWKGATMFVPKPRPSGMMAWACSSSLQTRVQR